MNERIKQLAEQAGLYVDLNGTPWPRAMSAEESEAAYKKFAELIVRECADWIDRQDESRCPYGVDLIEHFGVEE
jgi:hypothetical protein